MISPRSTKHRALSIVLALSFVWTIVACVSLCLHHEEEQNEALCESSAVEIADAAGEDACCPVTSAPESLMPERRSSTVSSVDDHQMLEVAFDSSPREARPCTRHLDLPARSAHAPPHLTSVLRI